MNIESKQHRLGELHDESKAVMETADSENRSLTESEELLIETNGTEFEKLRADVGLHDSMRDQAEFLSSSTGRKTEPSGPRLSDTRGGTGSVWKDASGTEYRTLAYGERMADAVSDNRNLSDDSVGRCLKAALTGNFDEVSSHERRALLGSSDTAGGYLLEPTLSAQVVDLARSASVVMKAGASTLPINGDVAIARVSSDPSFSWRPEGVAVTSSVLGLERITLRPKTLAAIVPISIELLEDAPNSAQVIQDSLQAALGAELDRVLLEGSGASGEPLGLLNSAGINTTAATAQPLATSFNDVSVAVRKILTSNFPGEVSELSWVSHPLHFAELDEMKDTTNQPLQPSPWRAALKQFSTTSLSIVLGGSADESTWYFGHYPSMLVGLRTSGVTIEILNSGSVTDSASVVHNAASELKRFIRAYLRADMVLLQPSWFALTTALAIS